ncbi:MAG: preprotein translocase subunit YajC [Lachnospiraceae bacterium]|nr:preprotein translocase subunit YajC [Lachnospiraceae bacterium]
MFSFLLDEAAGTAATTGAAGQEVGGLASWLPIVIYVVILGAVFYFLAIRPQKKQQKQQAALIESIAVGDSVLTTSGFYGVVIDVMDEVLVVEFGNNKNCRIPMKKTAVVEVEKPVKDEA